MYRLDTMHRDTDGQTDGRRYHANSVDFIMLFISIMFSTSQAVNKFDFYSASA